MTKMIALRDEAYEILASFKSKGESFSDVIFKLKNMLEGRSGTKSAKESLLACAGMLSWDEGKQLLKSVIKSRYEHSEHKRKF